MKETFSLALACVISALLFVAGANAQHGKSNETLASLKAQLAQAVEAGRLTKEQAVQKYNAAATKLGGSKGKSKKADLSVFGKKLKALVAEGKLTEEEAMDLYKSAVGGDSSKDQVPQEQGVKGSDYKITSLEEQQRLSATLPSTSTAGDQEGPVATGFFGWAAEATHRFMDNSHQGEPRLIEGLSFRLDYLKWDFATLGE